LIAWPCLPRAPLSARLRLRENPIDFGLPQINAVADLLPALSAIAAGVAAGALTAEQAGHQAIAITSISDNAIRAQAVVTVLSAFG
jgi:hypothetical protein